VLQQFSEGDRVTLPSGQTGAIVRPEWLMPVHHLIRFDDGTRRWALREILRPAAVKTIPKKSKRKTA
jgi:hypothetical protein